MNIDELIARINYLYKKSTNEGLSPEELEEQKILRRRYIDNIKSNFRVQLETIKPKNECD